MIQASLDTLITFKIFSIFRDRMVPLINEYRKTPNETELYNHLFLAPESFSKRRAFQVKGIASPFICLWSSSPLSYVKEFYSRSVLPRDFQYIDSDGKTRIERGYLNDYQKSFELSSSSFFADFRGSVMQDLLDLDRLRYVKINVDELLPGFSCVIELMLESLVQRENVDQASDNRSFDLGAKYTVKVTLPVLSRPELYIENIRLFLNSELIWQKEVSEVVVDP